MIGLPQGIELWTNEDGFWREYDPIEPTWLWTDGLTELVMALREDQPLLASLEHDIHLIEVLEAAATSAAHSGKNVAVNSRFPSALATPETFHKVNQHLHDRTRPPPIFNENQTRRTKHKEETLLLDSRETSQVSWWSV